MELNSPLLRDDGDGGSKQHMAAQACQTCRQRKVKCDEERPRCKVCRRLNVACEYRETKATKKDKTLTYILDTLKSLEVKFDRALSSGVSFPGPPAGNYPSTIAQMRRQTTRLISGSDTPASMGQILNPGTEDPKMPNTASSSSATSVTGSSISPYFSQIEARKLLAWPAIQALLQDDLAKIPGWDGQNDGGEKWLTKVSMAVENPLPLDEAVNFVFVSGTTPPSWEHFYTVTLPQAYSTSFDQHDGSSTLVLLVLALGAVAQEGVSGDSILEESTGRSTGIRGGTSQRTPGLVFLNEARRRIGVMISAYDLIILQCFLLLSIYYSQCSRNLDYWHMTTLSCTLCQNLVRTVDEWTTLEGDLLARSYWMCTLLEGGLTSELGLTSTGITDLENSVPLPLFLSNSLAEKSSSDEELFIEYHFLAQITLRTLLNRINSSLRYFSYLENPFLSDGSNESPPTKLIQELSRQLYSWREHLPPVLNWSDDDTDYSTAQITRPATWYPTVLEDQSPPTLLGSKIVLNASLRTRYKYAQYLIWRPYIYKLLHFPNISTEEDVQGCREAFAACCFWPLTHPIFQDQRRLIPHIYEYNHTFFGVLVLLHVCFRSPALRSILEESEKLDELESSKGCMLSWMRDMQVVHPVARWCWQLLKVIFNDHPLVKDLV